jgi:hypothetical protein
VVPSMAFCNSGEFIVAKLGNFFCNFVRFYFAINTSIEIEDNLYYIYVLHNNQLIMHNTYDKNTVTTIVFGERCFESVEN